MRIIIVVIIVLFLGNCKVKTEPDKNSNSNETSLSRIEQVKSKPFRNLNLSGQLMSEIENDITLLFEKVETLDTLGLFWKTIDNEIVKIDSSWDAVKQLIDYSYNLWKDHDIISTFVIYPSETVSASTNKVKKLYVIEIEHKDLTGTCRMFFKDNEIKQLTELSYFERN